MQALGFSSAADARLCRAARRHARLLRVTPELRIPAATPCQPSLFSSLTPCRASSGQQGDGDMDALAKMLSQQAAKMRASMSEEDVAEILQGEREQMIFQQVARLGPQLTAELEARVMAEVGDGGFEPHDFEILTRLGRISVSPASGPTSGDAPRTAVIAYAARYIARIAYSLPVTTMIKEYLPVAKSVAFNELLLLQHLCGIPEDKYQAAVTRPRDRVGPPVVPLLGYFMSAPSEDASAEGQQVAADGSDDESLWLVYKWEGLRPLGLFMEAGPPEGQPGFFKSKEVVAAEAWSRRSAMLRSLASRLLSAVDFIHSADVVHGSLSSGSVLMNASTDITRPDDDLVVKLDGFGFGKWYSVGSGSAGVQAQAPRGAPATEYGPVMLDAALEEGKKADLQAAGVLLVEAFAAGLADTPAGHLPATTLRRLLFDVFHEDSRAFRDYCLQDANSNFERLILFLDEREGAGWQFLNEVLQGKHSALQLSSHKFLRGR